MKEMTDYEMAHYPMAKRLVRKFFSVAWPADVWPWMNYIEWPEH